MIIYIPNSTSKDVIVTKAAQHEEELMKSDFVRLSWDDVDGSGLPVDAYIVPFNDGVQYRLLEPYQPEQKDAMTFHYEPQFQHPKMYLGKVPFDRLSYDVDTQAPNRKEITLIEWSYTGFIGTLLEYFCEKMNAALGLTGNNAISYETVGEFDNIVSTTFSAQDILSALSNVANLLECEWHIDWQNKTLYFGHITYDKGEVTEPVLEVDGNVNAPSIRISKEGYYNAFEPQGSTRNITKRAENGENVQSNVRLSLREYDNNKYPDGIIYTDNEGNVITKAQFDALGVKKYLKSLIFENCYPKLDLYLYDVRYRERYLRDENGDKVIDHYNGSTPVYKRYAIWYFQLAYPTKNAQGEVTAWNNYTINPDTQIIDGKVLMGAIQANTTPNALSSPLAGQGSGDGDGHYGFELRYHTEAETISPEEEGDTGVTIKAHDFEIVLQQGDNLIIPTTQSEGMIPKGESTPSLRGNIINLYNIVMDASYTVTAQNDLENETLKYIAKQFDDNNTYTVKSNPVAFEDSKPNLYIGRRVEYVNGREYTSENPLITRVMKLVTNIDYDFEQEITIGNEVLKGNQTTMREKVDFLVSAFMQGSGGGMSEGQIRRIIENWVTPRFLSKLNDDTAQGFIRMLKGIQVGAMFTPDILGEGGVFRMNADGKVELVTDILYARVKAYFDNVEVCDYQHTSGNRIASQAQGFKCSRVEWYDSNNQVLKQTVANRSSVAYFRCYWRVDDGQKKTDNQFIIGDLAFCKSSEVTNDSLVTNRFWRLVIDRNEGTTTTEDGEAWVDLSNAHNANGTPKMTTITWIGQGGTSQSMQALSFEAGSGIPTTEDDICQLGNVRDNTRQGAIIEYVSSIDSPTYQIYQDIGSDATNPYSLNNKNYIGLGYNTATGRAYMNVYGDAYIGARPEQGQTEGSTYIHYMQDDGTEQHRPLLKIKAKVEMTSSQSTIDDIPISQYQFYDDTAVWAGLEGLQEQIDGEIDTWFYEGTPTLSNLPASDWNTETLKERHLGDLYYDIGTGQTAGFAYRFIRTGSEGNYTYSWQYIEDTAITEALAMAARAQDTADHKRAIFSTWNAWIRNNVNTLKEGDLFIPTSDTTQGGETYKAKKVYKCTADATSTFVEINYTDDSALLTFLDGYSGTLTTIQNQIDKKAETYYQNSIPTWSDADANHVGDLWYCTANIANTNYKKDTTWYYDVIGGTTQNPTYGWRQQNIPQSVFDTIDGKRAIYTEWNAWGSKLAVRDLYIPSQDHTEGSGASAKTYKTNKVYRCTNASTPTFEEIDYTDDSALTAFLAGYQGTAQQLKNQIDQKAETWYQNNIPSNATGWVESEHVGDLWYCTANISGTNYKKDTTWQYVDNGSGTNPRYEWKQQNIPKSVFDTIDGKSSIFVTQPSNYKANDLWILAADTTVNNVAYKQGEVLTSSADSATYVESHWSKKVRYTDDTKYNGFITALLNGMPSGSNEATVEAALNAIKAALNQGTTISGGLVLSTLIGLRDSNSVLWAGISGQYTPSALGKGIAAWFGGAMADMGNMTTAQQNTWNAMTDQQKAADSTWAKTLFRFDGSGYLAANNIYWNAAGAMTIKNLDTIQGTAAGSTVNINTLSSITSIFNTETYGTGSTTELLVKPQNAFSQLFINRTGTANASTVYPQDHTINDWSVLNYGEMKARFVPLDFFNALFTAFSDSASTSSINPQTWTASTVINNLKVKVGLWTQQYISALGQNAQGGGGGGASALTDLVDVQITNPTSGQVLKYDGTGHWINGTDTGGISISDMWEALATNDSTKLINASHIPSLDASKITSGTFDVARIPSLSYVKLSATEQTIESTIGSYKKGIIEFYRSSGNHVALINFANKDANGNKQTLGAIGFQANGIGDLRLKTGSTYYKIWNESNDGTGSGLDADLLDGQHGSYYATASSVSTLQGYFTSGSANTAVKLKTARTLWGQSFDGTANVSGNLYMIDPDAADKNRDSAKLKFNSMNISSVDNDAQRSPYIQALRPSSGYSYCRKRLGFFTSNAANYTDAFVEALSITPDANIGINNTDPTIRLDVAETTSAWAGRFHGSITTDGTVTSRASAYLAHSSGNGMWLGVSSTTSSNYIADFKKGITAVGSGGTSVLRINADGNIGIGTTSPSNLLDVNGTIGLLYSGTQYGTIYANSSALYLYAGSNQRVYIRAKGADTSGLNLGDTYFRPYSAANGLLDLGTSSARWKGIYGTTLNLPNNSYFYIQDSDGTDRGVMYITTANDLIIGGGSRAAGNTYIYGTNIRLRYGASGTNDGILLDSSGNVGIGTTSPSTTLHVNGTTTTNNILPATTRSYTIGSSALMFSRTYTEYLDTNSSYALKFATRGTERMRVTTGGNVYIGQTSGSYKLDVAGVIHSTTGIFSDAYVSALGQNTSSDIRKKDIKENFALGIDEIAAAPIVRYELKDNRELGRQVGSIAQYWQRVLPESIHEDGDGYLTMQYGVIALLASISAARKIQDHERRIKKLEKENMRLRTEVEQLKAE